MKTFDRIARIEQRIAELESGQEIDAKHINAVLSKERQQQFAEEWQQQQKLRKANKPSALAAYETLHKQASALLARCLSSPSQTKAEQATLIKLQTKCVTAIQQAHAEITKQVEKETALAEWLDRVIADIDGIVLDSANEKTVKHNNTVLNDSHERLPILVTSKNKRRRVTQAERFGWQTKRDIRLRLLRDTLNDLNTNLLAELRQEEFEGEVKSARVFMDAWVAAVKDGKNAWAAGNAALQRNGFRRIDTSNQPKLRDRDRKVREIEETLLKRFEEEMTDEEKQQFAGDREHNKWIRQRRKTKGF